MKKLILSLKFRSNYYRNTPKDSTFKYSGAPKEASKFSHKFTYGNIETIKNLLKK